MAIKKRLKPAEPRATQDTADAENILRIHEWVINMLRDKKALLRKEEGGEDEKPSDKMASRTASSAMF